MSFIHLTQTQRASPPLGSGNFVLADSAQTRILQRSLCFPPSYHSPAGILVPNGSPLVQFISRGTAGKIQLDPELRVSKKAEFFSGVGKTAGVENIA